MLTLYLGLNGKITVSAAGPGLYLPLHMLIMLTIYYAKFPYFPDGESSAK